MAKTIAISDELYALLKSSKAKDESFSQIIKRNLKKRPKLSSIAGRRTIEKADWKGIKDAIAKAELEAERKLFSIR